MSETTVELDTKEWDGLLEAMMKNLKKSQAILKVAAQAYAFQDIIQHFVDMAGPDGNFWPGWAKSTVEIYRKEGKLGNRRLQDTGYLRKSLLPQNGQMENAGSDGIRLFTNVEYAGLHNYGGTFKAWGKYPAVMPKREFMWLSDDVQEKMVMTVAQMILEESA